VLDAIDAPAVRRWTHAALDGLAQAREEIDALNVFPVPDGDTAPISTSPSRRPSWRWRSSPATPT
jgi:hypothetical protein